MYNAGPISSPTTTSTPSTSTTTTSHQATKRLRTTITPEQLHFLYDCYQQESNPSRKMLEQIAKQVNLKKRVVQVWYQNSRARERKGQYRTNTNVMPGASSATGNLLMDSFVGTATAMGADNNDALDALKAAKIGSSGCGEAGASDLGFLFNSFKQHY